MKGPGTDDWSKMLMAVLRSTGEVSSDSLAGKPGGSPTDPA